ncbi:Macrophage infectivity potentiator [Symbiodinium microadriaticum]|uniref:peptidylprolyl isomerase n=1 Tax=Symbiodinium microadriaticum TaxID=2951 RepID=A0A1Q9DWP1_SYMMI|nr:Macrophage infectivity potentiator [Symbiodinium microadriaticum]
MSCFSGCFAFARSADLGPNPTLRILTANDVYKPERFGAVKTLSESLSGLSATKLVLPGDLLGGSLFANVHRGESVVDVLNAINVDYCVLGNHEFDYGAERTKELMSQSKFPWLGSNVRETAGPAPEKPLFHNTMDHDTFDIPLPDGGSVKVGVFGLCTPATPQLSQPGKNVIFEQPHEHADRCVKELKGMGCALESRQVAATRNADHLGVLDLFLQRSGGKGSLEINHSFKFLTTSMAAAHPSVLQVVDKWQASKTDQEEEEVLCMIGDVELSSRTNELRTRENAFGCLVADAMRWTYREQGCQAAIINGGFIRQDRSYPAHTALTKTHVSEEMPFTKRVALLRLTGRALRQGLEEMLRPPPPTSSFPHVSEGLHVVYSPSAPALSRIQKLEIDGKEVDPDLEYLIAVSEFYILVAGDGVETFHTAPVQHMKESLIREHVVAYLHTRETVSGALPRRVELGLRLKYEQAVATRNFTGTQLIDRNDELCILWEKANIQEKLLKKGESDIPPAATAAQPQPREKQEKSEFEKHLESLDGDQGMPGIALNMQQEFDFGADDLMDGSLAQAADISSASASGNQPKRVKLKQRDEDLSMVPEVEAAAQNLKRKFERMCAICMKVAAIKKFLFCKPCKRDVQACRAAAEKEGRLNDWNRLTKTPEDVLNNELRISEKVKDAMQRKEEEIRSLKIDLGEVQRQLIVVRGKMPEVESLAESVAQLREKVASVRKASEEMSRELENPKSSLRKWRKLGGEDLDQETLRVKIQDLQERLNDKKEALLEKELILEEVTALSEKLRNQALDGRQGTLELSQKCGSVVAAPHRGGVVQGRSGPSMTEAAVECRERQLGEELRSILEEADTQWRLLEQRLDEVQAQTLLQNAEDLEKKFGIQPAELSNASEGGFAWKVRGRLQLLALFDGFRVAVGSRRSQTGSEAAMRYYLTVALLLPCALAGTNEVGKKFLEENAKREGVVTLPSGLQYKVLREGHGEKSPLVGTPCECHYAGTTPSLTPDAIDKEESQWTEFDSSYKRGSPTTFAPNQVIKGWTEAMQLMVEGRIPEEVALTICAANLTAKIKGGDVLIFNMEIMKIKGESKPAERCDVETLKGCNDKAKSYIEKQNKGTVEKRKAELKRLQGMTGNDMKEDNKNWLMSRIGLLKKLTAKDEL